MFADLSEFLVRISISRNVKNFQNGCRIEILATFKNAIYWYSSHILTLAILLATFCAFEWRSNLNIYRVMVILRFDLLFDIVTYLFDLLTSKQWYIHVWCYITYMDQDWWWLVKNFDQYLWDSEQWHFHFKMNIEGWDSEVTLWHHRPPDQCQKYFFLSIFFRSFRIFGQN